MINKNTKRYYVYLIKTNKLNIFLAICITVCISIVNLAIPQLIRIILDVAVAQGNIQLLIKILFLYLFLIAVFPFFNILQNFIYVKIKKKVSLDLKLEILNHLSKLSGDYYTNIKTGSLLNIIQEDISIVENFGVDVIINIIVNSMTSIVSFFILINIQFDMFIIVLLLQLAVFLIQKQITKMMVTKTKQIRNEIGEMENNIQEYISNIMNFVICKCKLHFFKIFGEKQHNYIKHYIKLDIINSCNISSGIFFRDVICLFIYGYGGIKMISNKMKFGQLVAFQQYTGMFISPLMDLIRTNNRMKQIEVSLDRIYHILDVPVSIKQYNDGIKLCKNEITSITLKGLSFSYSTSECILKNITMKFQKGKVTAIVGSSGCGKSTIVRLLYRLWNPTDGEIKINDIPINKLNLKWLRKNIAIISQDMLLLDDSILNNLILGDKKITRREVEKVCQKVGILTYINELSENFDTIIGEKGIKISGGQKQKIIIARSLLQHTPIIIFDEATSALDNLSQKYIMDNIKDLLINKITIVIAHRLSSILSSDIIYLIENGKIKEEGSHDQLVKLHASYYNFYTQEANENEIE